MILLLLDTIKALPLVPRYRKKVCEQIYEIGYASLMMSCIMAMFIGAVLTLQTGPPLVERGLGSFVGGIVGRGICRELAPVMMAILLAGRIGSAMAAEIGSMKVYQEIDALKTMRINPIHYLVLPRVIAICLALPVLTLLADLTGWLGGALVASTSTEIGLSFNSYFAYLGDWVKPKDILGGLGKSFCFALVTGIVCCHQGLGTIGGPRGIGRSVTKAVVNSIILILVVDYMITRLLIGLSL
ncbi:ABC transporter permease [Verrucomicrobia bacterium]|nr:ABC transporter permease [Verrucomicrobiota bacterium]